MPAEPTTSRRSLKQTSLPDPDWQAAPTRLRIALSLRQIMLLLIYCAVASMLGRYVYETGASLQITFLGIWLGLGISYLGIWLAFRLSHLAIVGWILFLVGYILVTASMLGILAIPAIPIVIGVLIYLSIEHRRSQQNGLLWVLAVAASRQIPLAPGVEALARPNRGVFQDRAHNLAVLLHQGKTLSEAIDLVHRVVPWDAPLLIRMGERTGALAAGLQVAATTASQRHHFFRDVLGRIGYLLIILTIGQGVVGLTAFFIVPKLGAIFRDFGTQLPPTTTQFIRSCEFFRNYLPWIILTELIILIYLSFLLSRRGAQNLPILGRLFRVEHKALILRSLAMVVDAQQPLDRALEVMAAGYPARRVRRKIQVAQSLIRSGSTWTSALDGVGLISPRDMGLLDAATRAGNLAWVLRTLADAGERRFAYRLQIGSHFAFLVAMILAGVLVLFITVALFTPLVILIERLVE